MRFQINVVRDGRETHQLPNKLMQPTLRLSAVFFFDRLSQARGG